MDASTIAGLQAILVLNAPQLPFTRIVEAMAFASRAIATLILAFLIFSAYSSSEELSTTFYSSSCPSVFATVKSVVQSAIAKEARMGASLLRLFFHDCFVNGCDGSILLDDTASFTGEKAAKPNNNSVRGFEVVDRIKANVEKACPGVVSCADILAIGARDSVVILGGPSWDVKLGRRDSRKASLKAANKDIPSPSLTLGNLISKFSKKGLSTKDLVALSGAHTIGAARCVSFRAHIYNDTDINASFAKARQANCPKKSLSGDSNLAPLDFQTPTSFDNHYYKNLINFEGLLHSDQVLYNHSSTDSQVKFYAKSTGAFYSDFVSAMIKMGGIDPLTGKKGEIRKNCRKIN